MLGGSGSSLGGGDGWLSGDGRDAHAGRLGSTVMVIGFAAFINEPGRADLWDASGALPGAFCLCLGWFSGPIGGSISEDV